MKTPLVKISKPRLLLVEGKDEVNFFTAFMEYMELQDIQIINVEGTPQFKPKLKALSFSPLFSKVTSIGVVRDADTNSNSAFQSVCNALESAELPVPEHPLVPTGNNPQVTVMILPGEDERGMLEDLCLKSVGSDPAIPCMEQYCQCLQQKCPSLPRIKSKAKVQVFLASRKEVGKSLGVAAKAGYWPLHDTVFDNVNNFLQLIVSNPGHGR